MPILLLIANFMLASNSLAKVMNARWLLKYHINVIQMTLFGQPRLYIGRKYLLIQHVSTLQDIQDTGDDACQTRHAHKV